MIFAHQGGWDEMLMVLVPVALVVYLLRVANKRVAQQRLDGAGPDGAPKADARPSSKPGKGTGSPGRN